MSPSHNPSPTSASGAVRPCFGILSPSGRGARAFCGKSCRLSMSILGDRLPSAARRNIRRGLVVGDDEIVAAAVLQPPLAADQRRLGRRSWPRMAAGWRRPRRSARRAYRAWSPRSPRPPRRASVGSPARFMHVDRDLEQRVDEADRLRPGTAGRLGESRRRAPPSFRRSATI